MNMLRIATLNCLNLALPGRRVYAGLAPHSPDEYIARTQWLAQLLDRMGADLLLLQEVFHERALSDVVAQTASRGRGLSCAAPFADETNGRPRLALVWRAPLAPKIDSVVTLPCPPVVLPEMGEHREFSRPVLRAVIPLALPGGGTRRLTLLNVHLKSRRPEFAAGEDPADPAAGARAELRALVMRAAEATGVRQLALEALRDDGLVIVGGDFNDGIDAVTTRIVCDRGWVPDEAAARPPLLHDVVALDRRARPDGGVSPYSILHAGIPERIDHLLVSAAFAPHIGPAVGHVAAVEWFQDHLTERRRSIGMVGDGPDLARIYPDHAPLCATIMFGP